MALEENTGGNHQVQSITSKSAVQTGRCGPDWGEGQPFQALNLFADHTGFFSNSCCIVQHLHLLRAKMELYPCQSQPNYCYPGELKHGASQTSVSIQIIRGLPANPWTFCMKPHQMEPKSLHFNKQPPHQMILIWVARQPIQRTIHKPRVQAWSSHFASNRARCYPSSVLKSYRADSQKFLCASVPSVIIWEWIHPHRTRVARGWRKGNGEQLSDGTEFHFCKLSKFSSSIAYRSEST